MIDWAAWTHEAHVQRRLFTGLPLALALACSGHFGGAAQTAPPAANPGTPSPPRTLFIIGDSTAAIFPASDARVGWGAVLGAELANVQVNDAARSGRSSKSFFDEGHFREVEAALAPGDLLLIQFGHNDEKDDPARHTDATTTFRDNLRRYINAARAHGATPILLTPISRRRFDGARVAPSHGDYPNGTRAVAAETQTPLIDMTQKTEQLLESFGPVASEQLFAPGDNTHLSPQGAQAVARLVVAGLRDLGFNLPPSPKP